MKVEKLEHSRIKVTFKATKEDFQEGLDEAFKINNEKVTIKGFRKGKAPKAMYLKHYGVESLFADAIDFVANKYLKKDIYGNKDFQIISQPELDLDYSKVKEDKGFDFSLSFDVYPEVTLGEYKGIEVKETKVRVTKEEVEQELDKVLGSKLVLEDKDGKAEMGDTTVIDFKGFKDGEAFPGGEATDYELKLGSNSFIPGFEDGVVGMSLGEEKDINVKFPDNYFEESLKGAPVTFKVTLKGLKQAKRPEINEELLKEIGYSELKTEDELKASLKEKIKERKEAENLRKQNNEVFDKLVNNATVDLPQTMIDDRYNYYMSQAEQQAKQYNIPLDMLLKFQGTTLEDYQANAKKQAEMQVKFEVVLSKVAEVEEIKPTEEDINKLLEDYAKAENKSVEELKKTINMSYLLESVILNKAQDFVLENKSIVK